jgi:hypothetical protein
MLIMATIFTIYVHSSVFTKELINYLCSFMSYNAVYLELSVEKWRGKKVGGGYLDYPNNVCFRT